MTERTEKMKRIERNKSTERKNRLLDCAIMLMIQYFNYFSTFEVLKCVQL